MALVESFSGIRGTFGKDFTIDIARRYGVCFLEYLVKNCSKNPTIVIGYDPRPSSKSIKDALLSVFPTIIDIGLTTTPIAEFSVRQFKAHGGIMITASHNEPHFNGLKLLSPSGAVLGQLQMQGVIDKFHAIKDLPEMDFIEKYSVKSNIPKPHKITLKDNSSLELYIKYLSNFISKNEIALLKKAKPKIVLDPNGGSGIHAISILSSFGIEVVSINTVSGDFKRQIEPTEESLQMLGRHVKKHNALFGCGFDCDADRVEIALANGTFVNGNYVLAIAIDEMLSTFNPKNDLSIVVSDATSSLIKKIAEKYNARVIESEVGEINVLEEMLSQHALIGGEGTSSGVIILPNRCRDGIVTILLVLKLLIKRKTSIEKLLSIYPTFYSKRAKITFNPKSLISIHQKLKKYYLGLGFKIQTTGDEAGGLKVFLTEDSFVWFRASKTEWSQFRIISDGPNKNDVQNNLLLATRVFKKRI